MQKRKNDHKFVYPNSPLPACLPAIRHNAVAPFACITIEMVRCSVHRDDEMKEKPKVNRNYSNDKNLNAVYMKFINIKRFVSFIRCSNGHGNAFAQRHRPLQLCAVCWSISWCALRCEKKIWDWGDEQRSCGILYCWLTKNASDDGNGDDAANVEEVETITIINTQNLFTRRIHFVCEWRECSEWGCCARPEYILQNAIVIRRIGHSSRSICVVVLARALFLCSFWLNYFCFGCIRQLQNSPNTAASAAQKLFCVFPLAQFMCNLLQSGSASRSISCYARRNFSH